MPDIPEASGANSVSWGEEIKKEVRFRERSRRETLGDRRIDPRTGIVSPQAIARDSVTVPTERHLTYARLLRALCIRLSFSPFFLYIASSSPFTPLVPYL